MELIYIAFCEFQFVNPFWYLQFLNLIYQLLQKYENTYNYMLCQLFAAVSVYDGRLPVFLFLLLCMQMDFEYCYESDDADYEMSPLSDSWVGGDGKPICHILM